ncbi:glycosyltransferase family 4 protein [Nocardioides astragali]|uniref:Glycosyltransferase family 4 protein n=1 Tax=Nocardioides astragali TaxID=1776736 RepID=A0ABW2N2D8_9ACTN|nr:glycosyltransferase family 4 protein [Nocardioides astragali]
MTARGRVPPRAVVSSTIPITAASFYRETLEELGERGYEVHVVTSPGAQTATLADLAQTVHALPMHRGVAPLKDLLGLARWILLLLRLRPAVVLGGTPKAGLLSMMAARITGVPQRTYLLQGLRLEGSSGTQRRILAVLEKVASRCSHRVVAVSPSLAREFERLGLNAGRVVAVPHHGSSHGVDTQHFAPRPKDPELAAGLGLELAVPVVVFIGRLTADKGPDTLIRALTSAAERGCVLQLLVIGAQDEPDSAAYLERLQQLGDRVRVRVLDHIDDVRPYLALSDLLVLPTRREGLPNVVLEAAAMGKPAVTTTATGAIDSVVDGVTGLLVGPDDGDGMGRAIEQLVSDAALRDRMGRASRDRAVQDFQPGDVARAIVDHAVGA